MHIITYISIIFSISCIAIGQTISLFNIDPYHIQLFMQNFWHLIIQEIG